MVDNHKIIKDITGRRIADAVEIMAAVMVEKDRTDQRWAGISKFVRSGLGPKMYPVGTQLVVEKETSMTATMGAHTGITGVSVNEETFLSKEGLVGSGVHEFVFNGSAWIYEGEAVNLTDFGITPTGTPAEGDEILITEAYDNVIFDVVDHRDVTDPVDGLTKPAMFLLMHHVINGRPFDECEAIVYAESKINAGSYYITIADDPWKSENNVAHYFTLTQDVPAGGQIVFPGNYDRVFNGQNLKTYSGPTSTTEIETASITTTAIVDAVSLGTTGSGNVNHIQRVKCGSNNYKESALRQWINSDKAANAWWDKTNKFDRPSSYKNVAGLLHGMDADFLDAVRAVTVPCKTNNVYELAGWTLNTAYNVEDKFFLASRNEMGWGTENVAEGTVFKAYDGAENVDRIKYDLSAQSTARTWWLRSPYPGYAHVVRRVDTDGSLNDHHAYNGRGAVAACVIM